MATDSSAYQRGVVVLAAGGTGGHLFPAQALGEVLASRGYKVHLMTDARGVDYGSRFPVAGIHEIPSATITVSKPWLIPIQIYRLVTGFMTARKLIAEMEPAAPVAVVGFGGYPSLPPLLAALQLKVPAMIHEQNAVMGRANRAVASRISVIASSFPRIANLSKGASPVVFTGNPVRSIVMKQWDAPYYAPEADETFRLLIFGGSQGARFFSEFLPQVFEALPNAVRRRLKVVQQCRAEDIEAVQAYYDRLSATVKLAPFFPDLPRFIASAHLVLCRSGASTIAELAVIGRPAILVPLPHAIDNDQLRNAQSFAEAGAGWVMQQNDTTAEEMAAFITRMRYQPAELTAAANAAKAFARPDAAERLADLVEQTAGKKAED
ncbi:MAG: undecaprenyldiphospho-muramoylpentapeptide beta-N-acetylglucosaminyltransferase [Aestuariivirgaceae bacterium]